MKYENKSICPICGASSRGKSFPFDINFEGSIFNYLSCSSCRTVFVDPLPTAQTFEKMYCKEKYHDLHYNECLSDHYNEARKLLQRLESSPKKVLDFGCGMGFFLKSIKQDGHSCIGVEFNQAVARAAADASGCQVLSFETFCDEFDYEYFDVIHLGDVLEHLPQPLDMLNSILPYLKNQGILFVEGPLETNPSLVFWSAALFGFFKRLVMPFKVREGIPTHLFRTAAEEQLRFFTRLNFDVRLEYWKVYETGWPYSGGGVLKKTIASVARSLGGKKILGSVFGNRFTGIFTISGPKVSLRNR
jgi:2-polyprenyl-3-methyl-5-hydroxy-6-metoxy-1,4-benzoquinol methylase